MESGSQRNELRVGIFVLVGLALVTWLAFEFGEMDQRLGEHYPLTVIVRDASGIREGSPVRLGGLDIGHVSGDPRLSEDFTTLAIPLRIAAEKRIPRGATVKVGTSGLMGDTYIRVSPPEESGGGYYEAGETVSADGAKSIDDLADGAIETLQRASEVLDEVGRSVASINELFVRIDEEVLTAEAIADLRVILANLRDSSGSLASAATRLDPLLDETALAVGAVRETAEGAGEAFGEVAGGMREFTRTVEGVDPVLKEFDATLDQLRLTLHSVDGLLRRLDSGGGLAAAMLHDEQLRRDLTSFVEKLERNGILFYPREGGLIRRGAAASVASSRDRPSASARPAQSPAGQGKHSTPAPAAAPDSGGKAPTGERRGIFSGLRRLPETP